MKWDLSGEFSAEEANESIQKYVAAEQLTKIERASSNYPWLWMRNKKRAAAKLELLQAKRKKIEGRNNY